jgi:hypothetical protein
MSEYFSFDQPRLGRTALQQNPPEAFRGNMIRRERRRFRLLQVPLGIFWAAQSDLVPASVALSSYHFLRRSDFSGHRVWCDLCDWISGRLHDRAGGWPFRGPFDGEQSKLAAWFANVASF